MPRRFFTKRVKFVNRRKESPLSKYSGVVSFGKGRCGHGEKELRESLEKQGYEVFFNGWPDVLAVRGDSVRMIEVKSYPSQKPSPAQRRMHEVLTDLGFSVEIVVIRRPKVK